MNKRDSFLKDVFVVGIGNVFVLISSVLVGLVVPKIMGVTNYGYYQIFTLYKTYTALMHAGFVDGILLVHGGQSYDEIDKKQFRLNTRFFAAFQAIISGIVTLAACFFAKGIYRFVFVMVGLDTFVTNITTYYQFVSQCTMRFKEWSLRKVIQAGLKIFVVLLLVILQKSGRLTNVSCVLYTSLIVLIDTVLLIWYVVTYREITFGNAVSFGAGWHSLAPYFKSGIALTISFEISSLIFSLDRQFVSVIFDTDTYGIYSFAYRLVSMVTTIVGTVSTVLFPNLKRKTKEQILESFDSNMALVSIVVFFCMMGYYPLSIFINRYLGEYSQSLVYFRVLFPGIALTSCINAIIFNYYKVLNKNLRYFMICCGVFCFAAASNYCLYLVLKTPESFSIASIITLFVWYIGAERYLVKTYSVRWVKNLLYMIALTIIYYACITFIPESLLGMLVYGAVFCAVTYVFYWELIRKNIRKVR